MCGPAGVATMGVLPLPKFMKKPMMKTVDILTPGPIKQLNDKLMPDSVRQEIIKGGGKSMLANPNSEDEQAANAAKDEEQRLMVQRAFAAKYNNQVKML